VTRPLALVLGTALLSAASLRQAQAGGPPDAWFAIAVGLAIAVTLVGSGATADGWSRLSGGWPRLSGRARWLGRARSLGRAHSLGPALLVVAAAAAVADRRLVVSSRGPAPDEVLLAILVVALPVLALLRVPARLRETIAIGLTLATYALVCVALIVGKPYHVDAVIAPHRAAELLLTGHDPYRDFDFLEAAARFNIEPALVTHFADGTPVRLYDYPALSFLAVAPFVAAGVGDLRWIYLAEVLVLALVVGQRVRGPWRPLVTAAVVGNVAITRQYVLAGIDPSWMLLVVLGWLALERRRPSALAVGLAVAARQTAWFVAPFYLLEVFRRFGRREALRRAAIAGATALLVHLPFLLDAPAELVRGVLTPVLGALAPGGIGLVLLGQRGRLPVLPHDAYTLLALAAYAGAALVFLRRGSGAGGAALALAPLYLAWRSLLSYFAFVPLLALVSDPHLLRPTERHAGSDPHLPRPTERDPTSDPDLLRSSEHDPQEVRR